MNTEDVQGQLAESHMFTEPCSPANATTYLHFCTLGGLAHPRMRRVEHHNGSHTYSTYHYLRY